MSTRATPRATPAPEPAPEPLTPTPAGEFRRAGLYQLPHSGHVVELRWPGMYALALQGEVPNPLAQEVLRLMSGAAGGEEGERPSEEELVSRYRKQARASLAVAQRCLVSPRLVLDREPNYEAGEIGPGDLHELDVLWINIHFVHRGPASEGVAPFRRA